MSEETRGSKEAPPAQAWTENFPSLAPDISSSSQAYNERLPDKRLSS